MQRRDFIGLVGSAAAAWPLAAHGQQARMPVIGLLQSGAPASLDFAGLRLGLKDAGQNLHELLRGLLLLGSDKRVDV
jgi:putative tryptophan/tyrosine transport system substrate-binding protein